MDTYKTYFVGLAFFQEDPEGTMRVLLPDGRAFNTPNIPPHLFSISIAPENIVAFTGWADGEVDPEVNPPDGSHRQFWPPPSRITMSGDNIVAGIDASHQRPRLPILEPDNFDARMDLKKAVRVGDFAFRQGTFMAFQRPNWPNQTTENAEREAAIVSTLDLPHKDDIVLTLTEFSDPENRDVAEGPQRTITVKQGAEIVIVNASRNEPLISGTADHSMIYDQLMGGQRCHITVPETAWDALTRLVSSHPYFTAANAAVDGFGCSNVQMS